ncbi:MAG: YciI family protein, partial [Candidatus Acidiferrales bacterium]
MPKRHFYARLIPPRATFAADMNVAERSHMREHVAYFGGLFEQGKVVVYGPVMDPAWGFGMAVLEAEDIDEARAWLENDPTVRSGLNTFTISPMVVGASRAAGADANLARGNSADRDGSGAETSDAEPSDVPPDSA